jgi:hypothetical protein
MNRIAIIALLILAGCNLDGNVSVKLTTEERLTELEKRSLAVREMVKPRQTTKSFCEAITGELYQCGLDVNGICRCPPMPDETDLALAMRMAEAAKIAAEMKTDEEAAKPTPETKK